MCEKCEADNLLNIEAEIEAYQEKLEKLVQLHEVREGLTSKNREFADSLYDQFMRTKGLSPNQWGWVGTLLSRVKEAEPIEGNFNAIQVMFRIATGEGDLQKPKIRLMSKDNRYVQLNFNRDKPKEINVYVDGWAGHGFRKFAGWIRDDKLVPYDSSRMSPDVVEIIKELAADPIQTAKAMAALLGVCLYCGQRLSDEDSKRRGYGPVCAEKWNLPK